MLLRGVGRGAIGLLLFAATGACAPEDGTDIDGGDTGEGASGEGAAAGTGAGSQTAANGSSSGSGTGTGAGGSTTTTVYPDPDWQTGDPADHGIDPAALAAAAAGAEAHDSHCLVVVRHGVIVAEHYWKGKDATSTDKSFSVAKSYTSALVGIAIENGDIASLDQSAADFIPEWQGTEREGITIRHLLSMTGGLEWNVFSDYVQMATFSSNHSDFAVGLDQDDVPGAKWQYHNGGVQIFEPIFRAATGMTIEAYADAHLWARIGAEPHWNHDPSENPTTYAHVLATCRDHARFGYLYLRGGAWSDGQVVPAAHVAASLAPSQDQNRAYGYLWWLNGQTPALDPFGQEKESTIAPWAPSDLFAARGFGDQFIDVIPSLDMVVVRIGPDPTLSFFDYEALVASMNTSTHADILVPILEGITAP